MTGAEGVRAELREEDLVAIRRTATLGQVVQPAALLMLLDERDALAERLAQSEQRAKRAEANERGLRRRSADEALQLRYEAAIRGRDNETARAVTVEAALARAGQREARVRALHEHDRGYHGERNSCFRCRTKWPCPTIAALDEGDANDQQ